MEFRKDVIGNEDIEIKLGIEIKRENMREEKIKWFIWKWIVKGRKSIEKREED